jgi:hypothetical protein
MFALSISTIVPVAFVGERVLYYAEIWLYGLWVSKKAWQCDPGCSLQK